MEYLNGNGQQVAFFNYTLDVAGNRTTMTDTEGLTEYIYDNLNRLTEAIYPDETWERFTMDIAGRRTRHEDQDGVSDYHYDIGDRLHSITGTNATTFTWDMNGNMMEKVTDDGITSYFYNARDKMVWVVLDDDSELNYTYYPESDLRFSTIDTSGIEQRFLYEGQNVVEELDAYNGELVSYIEGLGIDRHLARVDNGNTLAYVIDALGTVRNVVGESGLSLNLYTFKAYGETRDKAETVENNYLYTGRRLEADTGDYYYRTRYYLPQQGMFGAVDQYVPDEMTYGYAAANPVMMVDPSGQSCRRIYGDVISEKPNFSVFRASKGKQLFRRHCSLKRMLPKHSFDRSGMDRFSSKLKDWCKKNNHFLANSINSIEMIKELNELRDPFLESLALPAKTGRFTAGEFKDFDKRKPVILINKRLKPGSPTYCATLRHEMYHYFQYQKTPGATPDERKRNWYRAKLLSKPKIEVEAYKSELKWTWRMYNQLKKVCDPCEN